LGVINLVYNLKQLKPKNKTKSELTKFLRRRWLFDSKTFSGYFTASSREHFMIVDIKHFLCKLYSNK